MVITHVFFFVGYMKNSSHYSRDGIEQSLSHVNYEAQVYTVQFDGYGKEGTQSLSSRVSIKILFHLRARRRILFLTDSLKRNLTILTL